MDTVDVSDFSAHNRFLSWFTWNRVLILLALVFIFFLAIDFCSFAFNVGDQDWEDPTTWNVEKNGVFSLVFLYFRNKCMVAQNNLRPVALTLISLFMMIQIATTWSLYEGQLRFFELIKEVIRFSFLLFLILQSKMLTETFIQGFQFFGAVGSGLFSVAKAAGEIETISNNDYFDPSRFIDMGWAAVGKMTSVSGAGPIDKLILFLCACVGYLGTVFIGLQITITSVEFYLFTGLGIILIPFGALRYTSFLFQKVISGIFSFGIRMMVVYFMAGLAYSVLRDFKTNFDLTGSPSFSVIFNGVLLYAVVGYLVWKIPVIVQGMISGTPQMDGGGIATAAKGFAFGTAAGAARGAGRVAGTWAKNGKGGSSSANGKPGPDDVKKASEANITSGANGSNNGAMAGGGDEMGPAAKEAKANFAAAQSAGGSSGSSGGAVASASQTSNTPEQAAGGTGSSSGASDSGVSTQSGGSSGAVVSGASAGGASGAVGSSGTSASGSSTGGADASVGSSGGTAQGQMSHGDMAWNAAKNAYANTKTGMKQYGSQVKADLKQSMSDGAKDAMVGASRLASAAGGAINKAGHRAFGAKYDNAVSAAASGINKARAIASDWTPTPVKQAPRKMANQVRDSFREGSHLRKFASDMGHQTFVNLPGVKQFYDGAYHAGMDTGTYDSAIKGSLKEYVNSASRKTQDPEGTHD